MSDPFAFTPGDGFFTGYPAQGVAAPADPASADPNADPAALAAPSTSFLTSGPPVVAQPSFAQALSQAGIGVLQANEAGEGTSGIIAAGLQGYHNSLDEQYARQRQARQDDLSQYALLGQIQARQNAQLIAARRVQAVSQIKQNHPELADLLDLDPDKAGQILADQNDPVKQAELASKQADLARANALRGVFNSGDAPAGGASAVPLSVQNNNPGNMKDAQGNFHQYDTPAAGMAAMQADLATKIGGGSQAMTARFGPNYKPTLANVITTWAPPSENDTSAYIKNVSQKTGIAADQVLTQADIAKISPAIIHQEGGNVAANVFGPIGDLPTDPAGGAGAGAATAPAAPANPYAKRAAQLEKASQIDPEHFAGAYDTVLKASTEWDAKNAKTQQNNDSVITDDNKDLRGDDFINTIQDPNVKNLANSIREGRGDWVQVSSKTPQVQRLAQEAAQQADPTLDKTTFAKRKATAIDFASGGNSGKILTSINTAAGHLADLRAAYKDLGNGSIKIANGIANWADNNDAKLNPKRTAALSKFNTTLVNLAPELAKISSGKPNIAEDEIKKQLENFPSSGSPTQVNAAFEAAAGLIQSRAQSMIKTYQDDMGGKPPPVLKPFSKEALDEFKELGAPLDDVQSAVAPSKAPDTAGGIPAPKTQADYDALPSGSTYTGSDGTLKRKK